MVALKMTAERRPSSDQPRNAGTDPTMAWVIQQVRETMPFVQQPTYLFRESCNLAVILDLLPEVFRVDRVLLSLGMAKKSVL
jgi:hypothetical protein